MLQSVNIGLLVAVQEFKNRKQMLIAFYERLRLKQIA